MFTLELDRLDYEPRQVLRGVFRFELPRERKGLRVVIGLVAMREGEIVFEQTRTLDGPKDMNSGTYSFEMRIPEEVKGPSLMKRFKQAIGRAAKAEVTWEVWGILDKEICIKKAFFVRDEDSPPEPEAAPQERAAPTPPSEAAVSVLNRLNIPPPDYTPSGRADLEPRGKKKKAPEPALKTKDMSEYNAGPGRLCSSCGEREQDEESQYCGKCGAAL